MFGFLQHGCTAYKKKKNLGQIFFYQGDGQNLPSYVWAASIVRCALGSVKHWHSLPGEVVECIVPGHIQDQLGWCSEQPDILDPAHGSGPGLDGFQRSLPAQTIL